MTTHDEAAHTALATPAPARGKTVSEWSQRAALPLVALFAFVVHLPVLSAARLQDDYNQTAMIAGRYPSHPGPLNLYDFINDGNRSALIERGFLPWWTDPKMELRFLRPLSSALLWLDYRVFGENGIVFEHLHSLFWWALASVGLFTLLKRQFSPRVATLGVLVFAIAPCHDLPLTWIANREALVSVAIGTFALIAYSRWRERRRARDGLASLALFTLAMLAGEYSLCFAGYALAIELTRPPEPLGRRAVGMSPFALPVLVYLATRHSLHYGAFGTGYYHDPLRDFGAYASSVPRRFSLLFAMCWAGIDDRPWAYEVGWKLALLLGVTVALLVVPLRRTLRELDENARRRATWLVLGSTLALAPIMAVGPSMRLLEIPMLGVSAGVALILDHAWFPVRPQPRHGAAEWTALVALGLAFVHLVRAPLNSCIDQRDLRRMNATFDKQMKWLRERAEGKSTVVVLRANLFQTMFVAPLVVDAAIPVRDLTFDSGHFLLLRTAPNAIELVAGKDPLFPVGSDDLVRNAEQPLVPGETVAVSGMRGTVVALRDDGKPRRLRFEFDRDLDNPSMLWVVQKGSVFEEQKLPAPGYGQPVK